MTDQFYVYEHWRPDTNTCFYVGIGRRNRIYKRKRVNRHHRAICMKLEALGLKYEVKVVAVLSDWKVAQSMEKNLIQKYGRSDLGNGLLANQTDGGEGQVGNPMPEQTRQAIAKSHFGRRISEETRAKMRAAKLGKRLSQYTKDKLRAANLGKTRKRKCVYQIPLCLPI